MRQGAGADVAGAAVAKAIACPSLVRLAEPPTILVVAEAQMGDAAVVDLCDEMVVVDVAADQARHGAEELGVETVPAVFHRDRGGRRAGRLVEVVAPRGQAPVGGEGRVGRHGLEGQRAFSQALDVDRPAALGDIRRRQLHLRVGGIGPQAHDRPAVVGEGVTLPRMMVIGAIS